MSPSVLAEQTVRDPGVARRQPRLGALQMEKIASSCAIGEQEAAELLIGGHRPKLGDELDGGYYFQPPVFKGDNKMRIFQEEIFGPVLAVTTFHDDAGALEIANDTLYGLGAGVWTRDMSRAYRTGRAIKAGRVDQLLPPVPGACRVGGCKASGVGRETTR